MGDQRAHQGQQSPGKASQDQRLALALRVSAAQLAILTGQPMSMSAHPREGLPRHQRSKRRHRRTLLEGRAARCKGMLLMMTWATILNPVIEINSIQQPRKQQQQQHGHGVWHHAASAADAGRGGRDEGDQHHPPPQPQWHTWAPAAGTSGVGSAGCLGLPAAAEPWGTSLQRAGYALLKGWQKACMYPLHHNHQWQPPSQQQSRAPATGTSGVGSAVCLDWLAACDF